MNNALPLGRFYFNPVCELGRGGLGVVDKIRITDTNANKKPVGSEWARKRLNERWAANPTTQARFEREIVALRTMHHKNIVTFEGEDLRDGSPRFYVMPVYSDSVRKHIARGGFRNDWRSVAAQGATLADALHYAHGLGFIHRDLKPDNLLFNDGGPIVVSDWGLGYFVHKESKVLQSLTNGGMGTEYYCSVEQWATGKSDARGDIYSLGMTLDEWCTGKQRQLGAVGEGITATTVQPASAGAARFNAVVQAMTHWDREQRPASMAVVATLLRGALALQ